MWVEILCGLVVYKLFRAFFTGDNDVPEVDRREYAASFAVANRLEKLFGGKAYVGLRIPDMDNGSRQSIDVVLVTKKQVMVIAVRNISGFVEVDSNGSWVCNKSALKHKAEVYANPVVEINRQIEILELYLDQRGLTLPKGLLTGKVVLPNPNCRVTGSINSIPEVITYGNWFELKRESSGFSSWIKEVFSGDKMDGSYQKLHSILSTSPTWDRLELKGQRYILGDFVEFKGNQDDMQALKCIKRAKVSHVTVQKASAFGIGRSKIDLFYAPRDFRSEGSSTSEWKETSVRDKVEVLFLPMNSKKTEKFKLSSIVSISLSV